MRPGGRSDRHGDLRRAPYARATPDDRSASLLKEPFFAGVQQPPDKREGTDPPGYPPGSDQATPGLAKSPELVVCAYLFSSLREIES